MSKRMHGMLPALLAGAVGLGATAAWAAEPSQQELMAQIKQLQDKVAALETKQASGKDVDATVAQLLADADRRSQLLQVEGFTAGYSADRGFILRDAQGDFLLHPYLQFQLRNVTNWRENGKSDGRDNWDNGFEIRRMKFGVDGNVFGPKLVYTFQWATDRKSGTPLLEDAWARYELSDTWAIKGGQFKDPLFHESQISSTRQLAADRSLLNQILEGGDNYTQGVSVIYDAGGPFRAEMAFTDGFNSVNTNFQDPPVNGYDFGVAGRAEYRLLGNSWKEYQDFSAIGNSEDLLVAGAAADWSESGDTNTLWHTVDAQWEPQAIRGLSVYGAYVGRYTWISSVPAGADDTFYDWGLLAQAGYMLNPRLEVFGRYDYTRLDNDFAAASIEKNLHEFTIGLNYYLHGHSAKLTADVTWLPNGSPISADGIGVLPQSSGDNQVVARLQFQLVL